MPGYRDPLGSGCVGSGGSNQLATASLPWIGATFSSTASGMAPAGLAVGERGWGTSSTPLSSILPQGGPGCRLLVTPDLLDAYVPAGGVVTTAMAIPHSAALVGHTLHQQVINLEITAGGAITAATSTNALTATLGCF